MKDASTADPSPAEPRWIWNPDVPPVNAWACFRKRFTLAPDEWEALGAATLSIFADSRYYAYVNGRFAGWGPIRGYAAESHADRIDVLPLLRPGDNVLAVLAWHFGADTHQYITGSPGLRARLDFGRDAAASPTTAAASPTTAAGPAAVITDASWKTAPAGAYATGRIRVGIGRHFLENCDAREPTAGFEDPCFDDDEWQSALPVPAQGRAIRENDRIRLTDRRQDPVALLARYRTRPAVFPVHLDFTDFPFVQPDKEDYLLLAFQVRSPRAAPATFAFTHSSLWQSYGSVRINGQVVFDKPPVRAIDPRADGPDAFPVDLAAGDNVVLVDCSGVCMGRFTEFALVADPEVVAGLSIRSLDGRPGEAHVLTNLRRREGPAREALLELPAEALAREALASGYRLSGPAVCLENPYAAVTATPREHPASTPPSPVPQALVARSPVPFPLVLEAADGDGILRLDFGEETVGFLEMDLSAPAGTEFSVIGFEYLDPAGVPEYTDGVNNGFRYVAREGRQAYRARTLTGFRYLEVLVRRPPDSGRVPAAGMPVVIHDLFLHRTVFDSPLPGRFRCPDARLNAIWRMSRLTTELCVLDTFVDCPGHEQSFWIGDFRNEALVAHYLGGYGDAILRCLELPFDIPDRSVPPKANLPSEPQDVLATWTLLWILAMEEYHRYTGDPDRLRPLYEPLKGYVRLFTDQVHPATGLLRCRWHTMMDWAFMETPTGTEIAHLNAELARVLEAMGILADALGHGADARSFRIQAEALRVRIAASLWDDARGCFADCRYPDGTLSAGTSLQTQSMLRLCGCCTPDQAARVDRLLAGEASVADMTAIGSPFASFFLYEALRMSRRIGPVLSDIRTRWGDMLDAGATTCYETFAGWEKNKRTRSHCHAWSAAPAFVLGAHILGVAPAGPGFAAVDVLPDLGDLPWAEGEIPTPRGPIGIRVERIGPGDEGLRIALRLPSGIRLAATPPHAVLEVDVL